MCVVTTQRPHHRICTTGALQPLNLSDVVEHLGSDTNLYANIEGLDPMMVRVHGNIPAKSGDRLGLRIRTEHVHVFGDDGTFLRRTGIA